MRVPLVGALEIVELTKELRTVVPTVTGLTAHFGEVEVRRASGEFTAAEVTLIQQAVAAHDALGIRQAMAQRLAEARSELTANDWARVTLSTVDAKIDAISNLADLKVLLKKLARYLIAKEVS